MSWQPISTAPKDGTKVLLYWPWLEDQVVVGAYQPIQKRWQAGNWWCGTGVDAEAQPTHWMPLPAPPEQQK